MTESKWSKISLAAAFLTIMVCFAANSVITRYLVLGNYVSPFILTVIRFVSGFFMLQIIASLLPRTFQKNGVKSSYILGALFLGIYAFSISYGYAFISAAAGVLIFYAFVVITMTSLSVIKEKDKLTTRSIIGQALGILGVLIITFSGIKSVTLFGAFLMAATGASWGLYSVYGRKFENSFGYTYNSFLMFGAAALALFLIKYLSLGKSLWENISSKSFGLALYMGVISTALSYVLWNRVIKKVKAFQGGIVQLIVPVLTASMGILFLKEEITFALITGGILILAGIFLNA